MIRSVVSAPSNSSVAVFESGYPFRVLAIYVRLICDATVGNRQFNVRVVSNSGDVKLVLPPPQTLPASSVVDYSLAIGVVLNYGATIQMTPLWDDLVLEFGDRLEVYDVNAVSTGDRVAVFNLVVEYNE